ncbi:MAG: MotA/TolQ/ExbB proton channel family protein [Clostridia bacterium]|nr:MotA/TolQ/ExbB proton channel family protein [Clostridia bacterium]
MLAIPGSDYLFRIMHIAAHSFLIPVIIGLTLLLILSFIYLGEFAAEYRQRRQLNQVPVKDFLSSLSRQGAWQKQAQPEKIPQLLKPAYSKFVAETGNDVRVSKVLAQDLLQREELKAAKIIAKTDMIAKLGPMLGLMGTLIPLGPGLAALGQGDVKALSQAVIVAFDTTVIGLAAAAIATLVSKVRRHWYEDYLNSLETMLQLCLGSEAIGETEK